jgi:hypothetical protein
MQSEKGLIMEPVLILWIVGFVSVFSFLAVASWIKARLRERQAFYKSEIIKKIAESQGGSAALDYLRDCDRTAARQRREGQKLGGLITLAVGIGFMIFLRWVPMSPHSDGHNSAYLFGFIPGLIGLALIVYSYLLAPKS